MILSEMYIYLILSEKEIGFIIDIFQANSQIIRKLQFRINYENTSLDQFDEV